MLLPWGRWGGGFWMGGGGTHSCHGEDMEQLPGAVAATMGTYRRLGHEHRVQARLRLDVLAVGVVQDGLEALPVLHWGAGSRVS